MSSFCLSRLCRGSVPRLLLYGQGLICSLPLPNQQWFVPLSVFCYRLWLTKKLLHCHSERFDTLFVGFGKLMNHSFGHLGVAMDAFIIFDLFGELLFALMTLSLILALGSPGAASICPGKEQD